MEDQKILEFIEAAVDGNSEALEQVFLSVQDFIFNMSLRMLGSVQDAEDAAQEIMVKIMTNLSSFRGDSKFTTWVYRITVNFLLNYKKTMFAAHPLDFEFYGNDIKYAVLDETDRLVEKLDMEAMSEELKMSCTNVMLQCLDPESRCIFILGTMFKVDSRAAGEILEMSPENYRQKLCRIRKKVGSFLDEYCGLSGTGMCFCKKRVGYAVSQKRLNPERLDYAALNKLDNQTLTAYRNEMEKLDELSLVFETLPGYQSPDVSRRVIHTLLESQQMKNIRNF